MSAQAELRSQFRRNVTEAFGMEALVTAWQDAGLLEEDADGCE